LSDFVSSKFDFTLHKLEFDASIFYFKRIKWFCCDFKRIKLEFDASIFYFKRIKWFCCDFKRIKMRKIEFFVT